MFHLDKALFIVTVLVSLFLLLLIIDWCRKWSHSNSGLPIEISPEQHILSEKKERRLSFITKNVQIRRVTHNNKAIMLANQKPHSCNTNDNSDNQIEYGGGDIVISQPQNNLEQGASITSNDSKLEKEMISIKNNDKIDQYIRRKSSIDRESFYYDEEAPDIDIRCSCSICLGEFTLGEEICSSINEKCTHIFHKECIISWLMSHDECPMCRQKYIEIAVPDDLTKKTAERVAGDGSNLSLLVAGMYLSIGF